MPVPVGNEIPFGIPDERGIAPGSYVAKRVARHVHLHETVVASGKCPAVPTILPLDPQRHHGGFLSSLERVADDLDAREILRVGTRVRRAVIPGIYQDVTKPATEPTLVHIVDVPLAVVRIPPGRPAAVVHGKAVLVRNHRPGIVDQIPGGRVATFKKVRVDPVYMLFELRPGELPRIPAVVVVLVRPVGGLAQRLSREKKAGNGDVAEVKLDRTVKGTREGSLYSRRLPVRENRDLADLQVPERQTFDPDIPASYLDKKLARYHGIPFHERVLAKRKRTPEDEFPDVVVSPRGKLNSILVSDICGRILYDRLQRLRLGRLRRILRQTVYARLNVGRTHLDHRRPGNSRHKQEENRRTQKTSRSHTHD